MVGCPRCRAANPDTAKFCGKCGQNLETVLLLRAQPDSICPYCGATVIETDTFCLHCGQSLTASRTAQLQPQEPDQQQQRYITQGLPVPFASAHTLPNRESSWNKLPFFHRFRRFLTPFRPLETSTQQMEIYQMNYSPMITVPPVKGGIECSRCHTINPDTAKFCVECNLRLTSFRSLSQGAHIGGYIIVQQIGVGGIGAVYLAKHQFLNQRVAIKVHDYFPEDMHVGFAFRQAANYLSQLDHPNIVHLYDYGFQNGQAYQAMEYINGPTLASLIPDQLPKSWIGDCLEYFSQLLSALHYAHNCRYRDVDGTIKQSIVHGDVKPQNIFLDRSTDSVKLADFMIPDVQAFLGEENHDFREMGTQPFGTPEYMAPEQKKGQLTGRSDIFSLGATMYQLVTGNQPQVIRTGATPHVVNPHVPAWLDKVIIKAMRPNASQRFQTVAEIIRIFEENRGQEKSSLFFNAKELFMGDRFNIETGDISNSGQLYIGKFNSVVSNLNATGQNELADALKTLKDAIMASQHLPEDKKEEQVEVINQIGEEAAKPKPNKTLLKMLGDGLIATLKVIPDVAGAVAAVAPMLAQLHI